MKKSIAATAAALVCAVSILAVSVPTASAHMTCKRDGNGTYVHDGYAPYAYLGLDHMHTNSLWFIGTASFGGPGAYLVWYITYGWPNWDTFQGISQLDTYAGTIWCPGF